MVMQLFGVDPRAIAVDEPSGHIFIADVGGATRRPGTLDWLPEWLRRYHTDDLANNPGDVMVLNAEP